ncbi:MAG: ATPase of 26S proteasome regulatory subunit 4 [Watsoniomyces obsoletus]|nr:MAG: ATPase of 26S proteasome regulatory subunit 4 [Watsoniomyces obsoletus]
MGMAMETGVMHSNLRYVTDTLTTTPPQSLPALAEPLVLAIGSCGAIFNEAEKQLPEKIAAERRLLVTKYKTQITALLQGNRCEGRWVAAVLIKATVEAADVVSWPECKSWLRSLLGLLKRAEPLATKAICIITISRLLHLCRSYQSLTRELSTPVLPTFISACLDLVGNRRETPSIDEQSPLLEYVLSSSYVLLPQYSSTFRPFANRFQTVLLPLLAPTPTYCGRNRHVAPSSARKARRLFVRLHFCATKNVIAEEWAAAVSAVAAEFHDTADQVFRSVITGRAPSTRPQGDIARSGNGSGPASQTTVGFMGLPSWNGIHCGVERLAGLLELFQEFFKEMTASAAPIPIGTAVDVLNRTFSLTASQSGNIVDAWGETIQARPEIEREERQALWAYLPQLHITAMRLLQLVGPSLPRSAVTMLSNLLKQCCKDVLDTGNSKSNLASGMSAVTGPGTGRHAKTSTATDISFRSVQGLKSPSVGSSTGSLTPCLAARKLLPVFLSRLQAGYVDFPFRAQIDRAAVLTQDKTAMMASVLQPARLKDEAKAINSIMPHLARAYSSEPDVEALLRPRMPLANTQGYSGALKMGDNHSLDFDDPFESLDSEARQHSNTDAPLYGDTEMGSSREAPQGASVGNLHQAIEVQSARSPSIPSGSANVVDPWVGNNEPNPPEPRNPNTSAFTALAAVAATAARRSHSPDVIPDNQHVAKRPKLDPMKPGENSSAENHPGSSGPNAIGSIPLDEPSAPSNGPQIGSTTGDTTLSAKHEPEDDDSDGEFVIPEIYLDSDSQEESEDEEDGE